MAAYAAFVSLSNNMEQIRNHPQISTYFDTKQMESLLHRVNFLLDFTESCNSHGVSKLEIEDLESEIASAAHAAEDEIESHIVNQIVAGSNNQRELLDLRKSIHAMDSVKENVLKVKDERGFKAELLEYSIPMAGASSRPLTAAGKSNMVGFDGYLTQILGELTGYRFDRQIIPIVGMGGIGKTTLAINAYDSLLSVQHFDVRAWVTVSEVYNAREILLETLCCVEKSKDGMDEKNECELGELLHKTLFGRRYLMVLDDMWSIEVWDRIKVYFPDNCNRSRIIVTTRIVEVSNHFASNRLALDYLDDDISWKLFCEKAFPEKVCPPELEKSGRKIVKKCRGLPLAIVVIGGVLGNSSRTKQQWENVEKDITSILNTVEDNRCLDVLSLSYSHLPAHLKPCFLYLGIFPEDDVIHVSRLVKLWVAEGFIKPNKDQSLEEIAEGYVRDLVGRNLVSVHSFRWNGKVKTFRIHDLLRDLCIRIAEKEKFFCVTSDLDAPQEIDRQRRIIIRGTTSEKEYYNPRVILKSKLLARSRISDRVIDTLESKSLTRSLISNQGRLVHFRSRLFRVLVEVYSLSMNDIFQQLNLRFLAEEHSARSSIWMTSYHLPSSISLLWNVQTLIITKGVYKVYAPSEIWKMPQLRHLMLNFIRLPDPPPYDGFVLHNLQTLKRVQDFRFNEEACARMPNIKKLRVCYGDLSRDGENLVFFNKLESLHYELGDKPRHDVLLQSLKFPHSLTKLTLERFPLQWEDLTMIGSLPHLEALILKSSVKGRNWDPNEGEFLRLRCLWINGSDLICWNADDAHFPALEDLVLENLRDLTEIPLGIGDIDTLQRITLAYCSVSAGLSAVKILEEQESLGNEGFQVKINGQIRRTGGTREVD